jgi:hypothetical protein
MSLPTNFAELTKSDPVMAALRALRDQLRTGRITAEEHRTAYAELERGEGQPCEACLIGVAYIRRDGRMLCASCALGETQKG